MHFNHRKLKQNANLLLIRQMLNIILTPASLPRSQTSGTGPSASCGYCCPVCPDGGRYPGKIRFIEPQGGNGSRRRAPDASSSGTPRDSQVTSLKFDFGVGLPGVRTILANPLVLHPTFLDKSNFPRILTPRVRYPQDPSTIPTRSRL